MNLLICIKTKYVTVYRNPWSQLHVSCQMSSQLMPMCSTDSVLEKNFRQKAPFAIQRFQLKRMQSDVSSDNAQHP